MELSLELVGMVDGNGVITDARSVDLESIYILKAEGTALALQNHLGSIPNLRFSFIHYGELHTDLDDLKHSDDRYYLVMVYITVDEIYSQLGEGDYQSDFGRQLSTLLQETNTVPDVSSNYADDSARYPEY